MPVGAGRGQELQRGLPGSLQRLAGWLAAGVSGKNKDDAGEEPCEVIDSVKGLPTSLLGTLTLLGITPVPDSLTVVINPQ